MKKHALYLALLPCLFLLETASAQSYELGSPDGNLKIQIENAGTLHFSVQKNGETIIPSSIASMTLQDGMVLGKNGKVRKAKKTSVSTVITPVVAIKDAQIPDRYNQLSLQFKKHFKVVFRAYDDAVAYHFVTAMKDSIIVKQEQCDVSMPKGATAWFSFLNTKDNVHDRWMNSYEHPYTKDAIKQVSKDKITQLPLLVDLKDNGKLLITESNLKDYPGLYFKGSNGSTLHSIFPPSVKTEQKNVRGKGGWDRVFHPETVYDYIAKTSGTRDFPWRIFAVANQDIQLLNNSIVYKLGAPNKLKETDWIKPGQVSWDWWNHWNITGVNFNAGINTNTYKYYIDFAARNHVPYIIMDDGWYKLGDLTQTNPDVNMKVLSNYARQKGVGIILWCSWRTLENQMGKAMNLFQSWGVKGIKVDFMNRDDQAVVNFYWNCAKVAAAHHLIVDFHGAHKPAGLERTYPNVVNYEGLAGLENDKWTDKLATPDMAVTLPYIRMFAGPMDYTPGAMRNAQKNDFKAIGDYPMSQGTRCQQLAMYVLFDAPLQMLSDNPTIYEKNKECLDFITSVPTTWDKTIPLEGKIGQYIAMARKKGKQYFAAAMTNWDARDLTIDFSFLPAGTWHIEIFQDGINADRNGIDYKKVEKTITSADHLKIHLAPGGGWAARIYQ